MEEELLLNTELTEESKDRARNLLKEFGLYEYRDAHPSALSGGQKQRLAIALSLIHIYFAGDSIYGCMNSLLCAKEYRESSRQRYMCLV